MDFVPVSEAVELYKLTRFGKHPALGSDGYAKKRALQRAHMSGRALNADEKNALAALVSKYRKIDEMVHEVEVETRKQLGQKLFSEDVRAVVQDSRTGKLVPIPGHYWTSAKVDIIIPRLPSLRVPTINFGYSSGPVLISRDDVVRAATSSAERPENLTVKREPVVNPAKPCGSNPEAVEPTVKFKSAAEWFRNGGKDKAEKAIKERDETITSNKVRREAARIWNDMPEDNKVDGAKQTVTKEAFKHAEKRAPKEKGRGGAV